MTDGQRMAVVGRYKKMTMGYHLFTYYIITFMKNIFLWAVMLCYASCLLAQTTNVTLTQKQVMNYEVGDVFHYRYHVAGASGSAMYYNYKLYKRTILSKTYNQDSSTVSYVAEDFKYQKSAENGNWLYMGTNNVTLVYNQLDSLCTIYFSYLNDEYPCQGTLPLSSYQPSVQQPDTTWGLLTSVVAYYDNHHRMKLVEGLGVVSYEISGTTCTRAEDLLWCKKGNQTFGTPDSILSDSNVVQPNVLKRKEAFNFDVGDVFQYDSTYQKYAITGEVWETHRIEYDILAKDTINDGWLYTIAKKDSIYNKYPPTTAYTQNVITRFYGNLEDWVSDPQKTATSVDSTCSPTRKSEEQHYGSNWNYSYTNTYYEGMGQYLLYDEGQSVREYRLTKLLYAHKAASNQSCGSYSNIVPLPLLKRNEVYNFEVGDILQFDSVITTYIPPIQESITHHIQYKILTKNTVNDNWVYTVEKKDSIIYYNLMNQTQSRTYHEGAIQLVYDQLNEVANPNTYIVLPSSGDSSCWTVRTNKYGEYTYYEGLGSYANIYTLLTNGNTAITQTLKYFYKVNTNQGCGNIYTYSPPDSTVNNIKEISATYQYPKLTVQSPTSINTKQFSIFNMQGTLVYQTAIDANQTKLVIPIELLANSLYIISLDYDETHWIRKIMLLD